MNPQRFFATAFLISFVFGLAAGGVFAGAVYWKLNQDIQVLRAALPAAQRISQDVQRLENAYVPQTTQEEKIIHVVKEVSPAVVSIVLTKDQPERMEVGEGSGFFVSAGGLLVTNKHVVLDDAISYTVFTKNGESYPATVLARDPVQDVAVLQVDVGDKNVSFSFVKLGDSSSLQIGQTVIAIGNALGEFSNTVSTGVISGLGRTITASDGSGFVERIEDVIQTDAAINRGNSGGPLLNLAGEVIGVNTATVLQAQSIGFAVPVNIVRRDVEQVQELGKIVYPFLGIRYILVTKQVAESRDLPVDYGALISSENNTSPIVKGSAAAKAGLKDNDIILEMNGKKITPANSLAKQIAEYSPGDTVTLKVLRGKEELTLQATLEERKE